jgi:hypothetical protein
MVYEISNNCNNQKSRFISFEKAVNKLNELLTDELGNDFDNVLYDKEEHTTFSYNLQVIFE